MNPARALADRPLQFPSRNSVMLFGFARIGNSETSIRTRRPLLPRVAIGHRCVFGGSNSPRFPPSVVSVIASATHSATGTGIALPNILQRGLRRVPNSMSVQPAGNLCKRSQASMLGVSTWPSGKRTAGGLGMPMRDPAFNSGIESTAIPTSERPSVGTTKISRVKQPFAPLPDLSLPR